MTLKTFLENKTYAVVIAKVAIIFQTVVTCVICFSLLFSSSFLLLKCLVVLDVLFVCLHLAYRFSYTGPKIILAMLEKKILAGHVVSSLLALVITGLFVGYQYVFIPLQVLLLLWVISLISGIVFFVRKYGKNLFLEQVD